MHRPLTPVIGEEEHMSLGDSELLANMYEPTTTTTMQKPQPQQQPQQEEPTSTDVSNPSQIVLCLVNTHPFLSGSL